MMEQQTHVVCYVKESKGYLDYNLRAAAQPIVSSDGTLENIADKVAASFRSKWPMASEIRYEGIEPVFVFSAFPPTRPKPAPAVQLADKTSIVSPGVQSIETTANVTASKAEDSKPSIATP